MHDGSVKRIKPCPLRDTLIIGAYAMLPSLSNGRDATEEVCFYTKYAINEEIINFARFLSQHQVYTAQSITVNSILLRKIVNLNIYRYAYGTTDTDLVVRRRGVGGIRTSYFFSRGLRYKGTPLFYCIFNCKEHPLQNFAECLTLSVSNKASLLLFHYFNLVVPFYVHASIRLSLTAWCQTHHVTN